MRKPFQFSAGTPTNQKGYLNNFSNVGSSQRCKYTNNFEYKYKEQKNSLRTKVCSV